MATRLAYRDSGYEFIRGEKQVLFSNGVCITVAEYIAFDRADTLLKEIVQRERNGATLYDFGYAVEHGTLKIKAKPDVKSVNGVMGTNYTPNFIMVPSLPAPEVKEEHKEVKEPPKEVVKRRRRSSTVKRRTRKRPVPPATPPQVKHENAVQKRRVWKPSVSTMVEFVMLFVAGGSAIMSAYHTTSFLYESGKPMWTAAITGIIMILFSATAFTAGRYFLQEKNASILFGVFFIALGSAVVMYSMFSTITVNYDQFMQAGRTDTSVLVETSIQVQTADTTRDLMLKEVERIDAEIEQLSAEAQTWRNQSWRRYDEYVRRIDALRGMRQTAWESGIDAVQVRVQEEAQVEEEQISVYTFVSGIFGIPETILRFIVYTIPAVFYDIASPFGFTIILLLEEKRRRTT